MNNCTLVQKYYRTLQNSSLNEIAWNWILEYLLDVRARESRMKDCDQDATLNVPDSILVAS